MTQGSVLKILKKEKKLMTPQEITDKLDITRSNVMRSLNKLFKQGEIKRIPLDEDFEYFKRGHSRYQWGII